MTTTQRRSHKEIVEAAATELASVRRQLAEARSHLARLDAENSQLQTRVQGRASGLSLQRRNTEALRQQFVQNCSYEAFSINGIAQERSETLQAQERYLNKEVEMLVAAEEQAATEDALDKKRHDELLLQRADLQERIEDLEARIPVIEQVKARAVADAGQQESALILSQFKTLQDDLDAKINIVALAEDELDTFAAEAVDRLEQWPDLRQQFRGMIPVHDAVTRVLESAISHMNTLLSEGKRLPADVPLPSTHIPTFWALLTLPPEELYTYDNLSGPATALRQRLGYAQALLAYYREEKSKKG